MKKHQKKKKNKNQSRVSGNGNPRAVVDDDGDDVSRESKILEILVEAFASSVTMEEAASAYKQANGDPNKAAEILATTTTCCSTASSSSGSSCIAGSSSSSSSNSSSDVLLFPYTNDNFDDRMMMRSNNNNNNNNKPKMKKVIAAAGTVSTVLGKDYVRSTPKKVLSKSKEDNLNKEEAEQFLCSMLGDDCELGLNVVSDVFCQCGYNLEKALDILLELSVSAKEQVSEYSGCLPGIREDAQYILESNDSLTDRTSDTTSHSSEIELQDNVWFTGNPFRNASKVSGESHLLTKTGTSESELPQKVLESLFNMPTPRSAEHEPCAMNWRNVVKQMTSLGPRFEPADSKEWQSLNAKGEEYQVLRENAKHHWDSMKSYYQKAATAYSNGEKEYAGYLSEQGRQQSRMAREADEKASKDIFSARNKSIENVITIDLHGQHIEQAMRLLKLHLLFGAYVRSVRLFRVITGCGSHGVGKSKLKISVTDLLKKEGVEWSEENRGTLLIRLNGQTNFSFLDSMSDVE